VRFDDGTTWEAESLDALANAATDGDDFIVGGATDDAIDGRSGDDIIQGREGNDVLAGGRGADRLDGGSDDDVYRFNAGDGVDRIVDVAGVDRLVFGAGIAPRDIQVFADPAGAVVLQRHGSGDLLRITATVTKQWSGIVATPVIERIEFADGTAWTANNVAAYAMSAPTTGSDTLRGSDRSEIIDGLGGNDYATGGQGDDSYVLKRGYGQLTISDAGGHGDALLFGDGITPDDVIARRDSNSLILEVAGTQDRVRVDSQFNQWNSGNRIERVVFADGTAWNIPDIELRLVVPPGTANYDHIYGSGRNDLINGLAGDDWLEGGSGDDVLDGGAGADQLDGGDGNDTLVSGASTADDLAREKNYRWSYGYSDNHDRLAGGAGNDTYIINADSGYDQITDAEGVNRIVLGHGLSAENVIISAGSGWVHVPVAIRQIGAQSAQSGQAFSYQFAADAFTDVDHGDILAYSARLTDGSALPDWLNFDAATHTFYGTPAAGNAGNLGIHLTATDRAGAQTSQSFAITVSGTTVDQAPVAAFDASAASEDNLLVASGNVLANDSDPEGKPLSVVNAGTRSGQWGSLSMGSDGSYHYALNNASTAVQSLAAGQTVFEHFAYQASDGVNSTAGGLTIAVIGRNDVPLLGKPLADKTIAPGKDVSWKMPTGSFADADQGDTLAYSARLANGDALPGWLKFDSATQTFSGRAPRKMKGTLDITMTASDGHGSQSSASDTFCITFDKKGVKGNEGVGNGEDPPPPGHDRNANDGPGASPGDPGSQGLHQDHEQGDRHERQRCHGDDCIKAEAEADDHRNRELACLDLNKVGACGREKDQEQHDSQRSYESNDFYKRWAEMDRALGQWLADDQRGDWLAPRHGADLSCLKGIGLAGGNVELGAGGYDNLSLNTSGALLKGFKGLEEGMHRL